MKHTRGNFSQNFMNFTYSKSCVCVLKYYKLLYLIIERECEILDLMILKIETIINQEIVFIFVVR